MIPQAAYWVEGASAKVGVCPVGWWNSREGGHGLEQAVKGSRGGTMGPDRVGLS